MRAAGAWEGTVMPRGPDGYTDAERLVMEVLRPCVLKLNARGAIWGAVYGSIVALPLLFYFPIGTTLGCLLGTAGGLPLGLLNGFLLAIVIRLTYSPQRDARRYRTRLLLLCSIFNRCWLSLLRWFSRRAVTAAASCFWLCPLSAP